MKKIVLIGAGGHCKVVIDIINSQKAFEIIGITDNDVSIGSVLGIPVIGTDDKLHDLYENQVQYAFICIGALDNLELRMKLFNKLTQIGFKLPVLVHRDAVVSPHSKIEAGTCVMAGAIVNAESTIGENCIINTGAIIEHDCKISNNCHISPGVVLAGGVEIGSNTHIGIGASVIQNIKIGRNTVIGSGAAVIRNIGAYTLAIGVPAVEVQRK